MELEVREVREVEKKGGKGVILLVSCGKLYGHVVGVVFNGLCFKMKMKMMLVYADFKIKK